MGWQHKGPPMQLLYEGLTICKPFQIATIMNQYFKEKVCKIRENLPNVTLDLSSCKKVMRNKRCKLSLSHVTFNNVRTLLKNLKSSKSSSVEGIDNYSLKIAAEYVARPLHHIITLSIMQQRFPTSWKSAKVVPLHKKGSPLERGNYRPVALLSPLGKILEKVIYQQIYQYFTRNKLFHKNLHGYRKNHSTQTALLQMYDKFVKAANQKQVTGAVLLDLSAAFDLVDHKLLNKKLDVYGVDREFREWINSYLTGRQQAVWISNCFSNYLDCDVGVPQGSNLGPLLFLVFYNDLPYSLECDLEAYADDSTLIHSSESVKEIEDVLTRNCVEVQNWMNQNRLKLNAEKTHLLTLGTSNRLATLRDEMVIEMCGQRIIQSPDKNEKLLGVFIQSNLKWRYHLDQLRLRLKSRLAGLERLKFIVPQSSLKLISQGIFDSTLLYCLPLFCGCEGTELKSLQVLQNRAAQIVTRSPPRSHRKWMFDKLNWLTINQMTHYHTLLTLFRIRLSNEPEYLATILRQENAYGRILRPKPNLELAEKSFGIRGIRLWNRLPMELKTEMKVSGFKVKLRKWVVAQIPRFLD